MSLHMAVPKPLYALTALGPLVRSYIAPPNKGIRSIGWVVAITGWSSCAGATLYGLVKTYWQYFLHGPAILWKTMLPSLSLALLGMMVGLVGIYIIMRNRPCAVAVYHDGIALLKGRNLAFWRWSEIVSLKHNITHQYLGWFFLGVRHLLVLKTQSGKQVSFDDRIMKIETLAAIAYRKTFAVRYAVYAKAYQNGHIVKFGSLSIHSESGLRFKSHTYPWQDIQRLDLIKGWLVMTLKSQKGYTGKDIAAGNLPDLDVLLRLVKM